MNRSDVLIRDMAPGEEQFVLALVMAGFDELVRPDFSEQGVAEFSIAARFFVMGHPPDHRITVAEHEGRIVGMIDVRASSHICLFFVDREQRGRGVGRSLLEAAFRVAPDTTAAREVTCNASPWAVPVYERLGFVVTGEAIEHNGMRAVPMASGVLPRAWRG